MTERPLSPEEKRIHSYLLGKGLYGGIQLKNILNEPRKEEEEEKFVIKLPKERLQQAKKASLTEHLNNIGHIYKGFKEKETEHYSYKKNNLHKELEKAHEDYLKALTREKKASLDEMDVPHVDAMCIGMLKAIEKSAEETISDGALSRSLKNLAHPVTKHFPSSQKVREDFVDKPLLATTLASIILKSNIGKEEHRSSNSPLNVNIEAI